MGKIRDWCLATGLEETKYRAQDFKVSGGAMKGTAHRLPDPYHRKLPGQLERNIQKAMTQALSAAGIWHCRLEGAGKLVSLATGERKFIGSDMTGMSDLIACHHGRLIAIECKVSGASLSAHQYAKLLEMKHAGALVMIVVDHAKALERLLKPGTLATCVMECGLQVF
jgi:hypothetical protein